MTSDELVLSFEIPADDEYCQLRTTAGLSTMSAVGAAKGLPNSWCAVCIRADGELVGMGRIVGDGGLFFLVVDIAVLPQWQRQGLGKRIMHTLVEHLRSHAPAGAMVGLFADGEAHRLYQQFGFKRVAPAAKGILLRL